MSRRKRRAGGAPAPPRGAEPSGRGAGAAGAASGASREPGVSGESRASWRRIALDFAVLIAVFAVTAGVAELAGAANLGVALGIGQVAFAIALVVLLVRG